MFILEPSTTFEVCLFNYVCGMFVQHVLSSYYNLPHLVLRSIWSLYWPRNLTPFYCAKNQSFQYLYLAITHNEAFCINLRPLMPIHNKLLTIWFSKPTNSVHKNISYWRKVHDNTLYCSESNYAYSFTNKQGFLYIILAFSQICGASFWEDLKVSLFVQTYSVSYCINETHEDHQD